MTDPRRQAFVPYIREIADRLRLRDWTFGLSDEGTDREGVSALICVADQRKFARVYLGDDFLDMTPEGQRHCTVHELLHAHFGWASNWARDQIAGGPAHEMYVRLFEIGVDGLADAIAPLMPLPAAARSATTPGESRNGAAQVVSLPIEG